METTDDCAGNQKDLHDIRVFNSDGVVVPHVVNKPANRVRQEDTVQADLPFFPLTGPVNTSGDEITIHIEKDEQGTIVDVKTGNGDSLNNPDLKINSYLIDGSSHFSPQSLFEVKSYLDDKNYANKKYILKFSIGVKDYHSNFFDNTIIAAQRW